MKKVLLACLFTVSSTFFWHGTISAQIDLGGVKVNVNKTCGTINGKLMCVNPATGQWEISTGNGNGVGGNVKTGEVGGSGTVGGVRVTGGGVLGGGNASGGAGSVGSQNFSAPLNLLGLAQTLVVRAVPLLIGIAMLAFFWFLIEFIWKGRESADEQKKGRAGMVYSLIALFVMVSVWGIIRFAGGVLGIDQGGKMTGFNLPGEK